MNNRNKKNRTYHNLYDVYDEEKLIGTFELSKTIKKLVDTNKYKLVKSKVVTPRKSDKSCKFIKSLFSIKNINHEHFNEVKEKYSNNLICGNHLLQRILSLFEYTTVEILQPNINVYIKEHNGWCSTSGEIYIHCNKVKNTKKLNKLINIMYDKFYYKIIFISTP